MKKFAELLSGLDETNKTSTKVGLLKDYFLQAPDEDKIWVIALFTGRRPKRPFNTTKLRNWILELCDIPEWLFGESYYSVGDLAETISLLLPPGQNQSEKSLAHWLSFIINLRDKEEAYQKSEFQNNIGLLSQKEIFVLIKLLTGGFRVGISNNNLIQALSQATGLESSNIAHRLMGSWNPETVTFGELFDHTVSTDISRPYPFFLAHPVQEPAVDLAAAEEYAAEWKWDGIRCQLIKRNGSIFIWSRGEELITDKFPELSAAGNQLPDGTVIDGELLPVSDGKPLPFTVLQTRIGRKNLTPKILKSCPAGFFAYDIMEANGADIRNNPFAERRAILENLFEAIHSDSFIISPLVTFSSWEELLQLRAKSREMNAEGFMIKRKDSPYLNGRKRGYWWKWKTDPYSVDAVLINAQKGHGKRAEFYTDYTFALWKDGVLCPFAKAYSGLTDEEIKEADRFIRQNTEERFGPVRAVKPELVFEIAFEGIQESNRHKCGLSVRFPRILRWRRDKKAEEADTIENLRQLMEQFRQVSGE